MEKETCTGCGCELTDKNRASLYLEHFRHICVKCFKRECDEDKKRLEDERLKAAVPRCRKCGKELTDETWSPSYRKANNRICRECSSKQSQKWIAENHERQLANCTRTSRRNGKLSMHDNKECPSYLGIIVTEKLIDNTFDNAERMPNNNHGYDVICGRGRLVEIKGACLNKAGGWVFNTRQNTTAEYFMLVAYDDRKNLNIQHVWRIPINVLSHLTQASIRPSTVDKWSQYEQDPDKMLACCNAMKEEHNEGDEQ